MKDKIKIEKSFFIQLVVSLLMSFAFLRNIVYGLWAIPTMAFLVIVVNMYFNSLAIGYKLKSKRLRLKWAFETSFNYDFSKYLAKYIYFIRHSIFRKVTKKVYK